MSFQLHLFLYMGFLWCAGQSLSQFMIYRGNLSLARGNLTPHLFSYGTAAMYPEMLWRFRLWKATST